jgi:hypothetical protein
MFVSLQCRAESPSIAHVQNLEGWPSARFFTTFLDQGERCLDRPIFLQAMMLRRLPDLECSRGCNASRVQIMSPEKKNLRLEAF